MSTQAEIENHIEVSERFLRHAIAEFENGDLPQASEKAWGAVAYYLKSVAKFRSWGNTTHTDLSDILEDLSRETNDPGKVWNLYRSVEGLHINFYEDRYSDQGVAGGIEDARELISHLENRTGTEASPRPSQMRRVRRR